MCKSRLLVVHEIMLRRCASIMIYSYNAQYLWHLGHWGHQPAPTCTSVHNFLD